MAHVKNVGGGPGDEDLRPPPHQPTDAKGKATKKLATRIQLEQPQLQQPQSVQRQEVLGVESRSQISFHQQ